MRPGTSVSKKFTALNLVRHHRVVSKNDLAALTGLSKTTIGTMTDELLAEGFIKEVRPGESIGGRPPVLLELDAEKAYAVGLDFEATTIRSVLVNFKGEIVASIQTGIETADEKATVVRKIMDTLHRLLDPPSVPRDKVLGVGIGAPGFIDSRRGIAVSYYSPQNWQDVNLGDLVRYEFGLPVFVDKNIRTMALAEKRFGQARDVDNMICIGIRSGMGLGIVIDGSLFRGVTETAGEIGHITIDRTGPKCRCGNRGCLQELASGRAIIRRLVGQLKKGRDSKVNELVGGDWDKITLGPIIQAAKAGDGLALETLRETGDYLGIALANVVNLFNPELIILAGGLVEAGDLVLDQIRSVVEERALEFSLKRLRIVASELGDTIAALGASALVLSENADVFDRFWGKREARNDADGANAGLKTDMISSSERRRRL